jgi:type II secretory ATPase GspE/PulE/Tfp pilus assembly ATPase PilB-like protein
MQEETLLTTSPDDDALEAAGQASDAQALAQPLLRSAGDLVALQDRIAAIRKNLGGAPGQSKPVGGRRPGRHDYLLTRGLITQAQLDAATAEARSAHVDVESLLVDRYGIPKAEVGNSLSLFYRCPFIAYDAAHQIPQELLKDLRLEYLRKSGWAPLKQEGNLVVVLVDNPHDLEKVDSIERFFGKHRVRLSVSLRKDILRFLESAQTDGAPREVLANILEELKVEERLEDAPDPDISAISENDSSIIRLANQIIRDAVRQRASDIHVEPGGTRTDTLIRFRIDGSCTEYQRIPNTLRQPLVARLKIMAKLDIAERRLPQDGKIRVLLAQREVELRVATIPTVGGNEDIVMRILSSQESMRLDQLELTERNIRELRHAAEKPYGLLLCVGPTGSGKTTTLHSVVGHINTGDRKIWTAEDPVEITQPGIRQLQVHPKIGLTFAAALRSFLRADPDVIMVGEMRDIETASIATEASLTGHLVLSTLHTNSAAETVVRLLDFGLDPFNFADALLGVLAQRLVKRICPDCARPYHPERAEFDELVERYGPEDFEALGVSYTDGFTLVRGAGCARCDQSGFRGRVAIHELLIASDEIRQLVQKRARVADVRDCARREGMTTLVQDGILKVLRGLTTFAQVKKAATR